MKTFKTLLSRFRREEDGAALVEYGVILLVVILVGTVALVGLAGNTDILFTDGCGAAEAAVTAANGTVFAGGC